VLTAFTVPTRRIARSALEKRSDCGVVSNAWTRLTYYTHRAVGEGSLPRKPRSGLQPEVSHEQANQERQRQTHEHLTPPDFAYPTTDVPNESAPSLKTIVPAQPARDRLVPPQHPTPLIG